MGCGGSWGSPDAPSGVLVTLGEDAVQLCVPQDDSKPQVVIKVASSGVAVAVGPSQPPPLLLRRREEPLVGQLPELILGVLPSPPPPFPMPEIHPPKLVPVLAEPIFGVHEVAPQNQKVHRGGVSGDPEGFPEGGACMVGVGLSGGDAVE